MNRITTASTAAAIGLSLLLAACGSDAGTDASAEQTTASESSAPASSAPASSAPATTPPDASDTPSASESAASGEAEATTEVTLEDFRFAPETITVKAGDTVTWTNGDATRHTVTAGSEDEPMDAFDEEFAGKDDTATFTFDEAGEFAYFCRLHPFMEGTVIVE